jgi:uncharacterized protein
MVIEGRTWLELIPPVGCSRHLAQEKVGRVALIVDGVPEIFPVNYVVEDGDQIYFRTAKGTKLDAVMHSPSIAFEIDGLDEERKIGWSVVAVGYARRVTDTAHLRHIDTLGLEPWAVGEKVHVVHLAPTKVTGRRIHAGPGTATNEGVET